jgi:hypothetical protein
MRVPQLIAIPIFNGRNLSRLSSKARLGSKAVTQGVSYPEGISMETRLTQNGNFLGSNFIMMPF